MSLSYNKYMIPRAKAMRKPMTKHEALLWYRFLRDYTPRFQRQKPSAATLWISIATKQCWRLSWTVRSTMRNMKKHMTMNAQDFLKQQE